MKVKLKKHSIVMRVYHYDEVTKVITVKIFGTMCKFQKHEYEIIEEK